MNEARLKVLLYNAIVWIDEECGDFFVSDKVDVYEWYRRTLGITKQELKEIGVDWDGESSEEIEDEDDMEDEEIEDED